MEDLAFPRIVYRGAPDVLGRGTHGHPETGELIGETKRVDSQDELDAARKDGWRLTRELEDGDDVDEAADAGDGDLETGEAGDASAAKKPAAKKPAKKK